MRVNDLTEESIKSLEKGKYVLFENSLLKDIYQINDEYDLEYVLEYNKQNYAISQFTGEFPNLTLDEFKSSYKDCEMFPIESIKKPKE